ncbi:MAG: hypothetical protein ABGY24_00655 [bacterium]
MSRRRTQQGAQTMATKQTDTVAMTEEQLDTVVGGAAYVKKSAQGGGLRMDKSSPKSRFTGCGVPMPADD